MTDRQRNGYLLTRDPAVVDVDRVHHWLAVESYWAVGRERDVVARSISSSRPWSVLHDGVQVAFARAVTDGATFAWVCDVFVDEAHRGRGLGHWLMDCVVADLQEAGVQRLMLGTRDAHEVYRAAGFTPLEGADRFMELDRRPTRAAIVGLA